MVAPGARLHADGVGRVLAGLFQQREAEQRLALRHGGDDAAPLVVRAGVKQRQAAQGHRREEWAGVQPSPHFVEDYAQLHQAAARAAILLWKCGFYQACFDHLAPDFRRVAALVLLQRSREGRGELLLQEVPGQAFEHLLRFGESKVHGGRAPCWLAAVRPRR